MLFEAFLVDCVPRNTRDGTDTHVICTHIVVYPGRKIENCGLVAKMLVTSYIAKPYATATARQTTRTASSYLCLLLF